MRVTDQGIRARRARPRRTRPPTPPPTSAADLHLAACWTTSACGAGADGLLESRARMIYCVVPEELARRALRQARGLLPGRPEREGHHRPAQVRAARRAAAEGEDEAAPARDARPPSPARPRRVPAARLSASARGVKVVVHVDGGRARQPRARGRGGRALDARRRRPRRGHRGPRAAPPTTSPSTAGCCSASPGPRPWAPPRSRSSTTPSWSPSRSTATTRSSTRHAAAARGGDGGAARRSTRWSMRIGAARPERGRRRAGQPGARRRALIAALRA